MRAWAKEESAPQPDESTTPEPAKLEPSNENTPIESNKQATTTTDDKPILYKIKFKNSSEKTPTKDSGLGVTMNSQAIQFQPVYPKALGDALTKIQPVKERSPDVELREINGNEFIKLNNENRPPNGNLKPKSPIKKDIEDIETMSDTGNTNTYYKKGKEAPSNQQFNGNNKSYYVVNQNWWRDLEPEIIENSVVAFNLDSRVDEEILYELFCKVGPIKRMKLFRISNREIDDSHYLKSLNLNDCKARPHKKKALFEYNNSSDAKAARKVFNGLELFGRKVFVMKQKETCTDYQIVFKRPNFWFDEYFCLDYFSRATNLVRVLPNYDNRYYMKYILFFFDVTDYEMAKEQIQRELKKYLSHKVEFEYIDAYERQSKD